MRVAVIDGDILLYKAAASAEHEVEWEPFLWSRWGNMHDATDIFNGTVDQIMDEVGAQAARVCLTSHVNFRKEINPLYKANRRHAPKPVLYKALRDYVKANHAAEEHLGLEADDVACMIMTGPDAEAFDLVGVSTDKDFMTIPGDHYNPDKKTRAFVTEREALQNMLVQTLTGDVTDGYKGIKGIGPVKAKKMLNEPWLQPQPDQDEAGWRSTMWSMVEAQYTERGYPTAEALTNARMAYLLRHNDYNTDTGEVRLWNPDKTSHAWWHKPGVHGTAVQPSSNARSVVTPINREDAMNHATGAGTTRTAGDVCRD
jgi:DNA polymerase-1